jgi:SNF2 family DNA or RNA helicase
MPQQQRVDRIGQKNTVVIRKLYMRNSIDVVMQALQERKAKVTAQQIVHPFL